MSNLEELVPPMELCRKIPEGCFADSALVWRWNGNNGAVFERDGFPQEKYPAPTLQEIMKELPDRTSIEIWDSYPQFVTFTPELNETPASNNGAEAALRLWLEVNKTYKANKTYETEKEE